MKAPSVPGFDGDRGAGGLVAGRLIAPDGVRDNMGEI
jgi:hypothetical protein